jgi:hypothetical protein
MYQTLPLGTTLPYRDLVRDEKAWLCHGRRKIAKPNAFTLSPTPESAAAYLPDPRGRPSCLTSGEA